MATSLEELTPNQIMQLAAMTAQLANDPATRDDYLRLVKRKNPGVAIPEIDAKDAVLKEVQALRDENKAFQNEINETRLRESIEKKRAAVMGRLKLTDDQMTEIEKLMVDKHLPDYDTAAEFFHLQNRVASPTGMDVANPELKMPDSTIWNKGIGNKAELDKIARSEAYKAWNEVSGMRGQNSGLGRAE